MKIHHTKNKGDLGIYKAQLDLYSKGFSIFTSLSEHEPFDIVAYKNKKFKRIQVKYRSAKNEKIILQFKTSWADKKGNHINYYDKNEIDLFCIYCPNTDECYYINPLETNEKSITLRIKMPKNGQKKYINMAKNYRHVF